MLVAAALAEMNRGWSALIVDGPSAAERHLESARALLAGAGEHGVHRASGETLLEAWKLSDELADKIRQAREPATTTRNEESHG